MRPRSRTLNIDADRMHSWSAELDAEDSPWHTLTLYGPLDEPIRGSTNVVAEEVNLRIFVESDLDATSGKHVYRSYFGPIQSGKLSQIGFWVDLPIKATEVNIQHIGGTTNGRTTWVRVDMGPSPDTTIPFAILAGTAVPKSITASLPRFSLGPFAPKDLATTERLSSIMQGHDRLFVRFTMSPTTAGDNYAYAAALRTEGGPDGPIWSSGLSIRVR